MTTAFWLQNLLFYSLQVLLVVLAGGALAMLARLRNPRAELAYLQGLLALCLLLPLMQPWQALVIEPSGEAFRAAAGHESTADEQDADSEAVFTFPPVAWLLLGGVGIRVAWLGVGFLRLARYRKKSRALLVTSSFLPALEKQFSAQADLRISGEVRGPVTFGWRRPVVLLPERFLEFEPEIQRAILCHELLHIVRHDWLFTVVEESLRALLWFHPAIWWLISRIHLVREQLVDREAIRLTESRDPYLRALLTMAGHHLQPDLAPASLFLKRRHLDRRMAAVLRKESPMSRVRCIAQLSTMATAVVAAVWLAASTFPLQAVPQESTDAVGVPTFVPFPRGVGVVQQDENHRVFALQGVVEQGGEKLLQAPHIFYSPEALQRRVEGRVVIELSVDENGRVYDAMVISGPQELRRAALMSVLQWQYSKEMSLPAKLAVTIRFELPSAETAAPQTAPSNLAPPIKRIRVGSAVQHARLVRQVTPLYPALARQARIQGTVHLNVSINPLGAVGVIDVLSGHPLLIPAAIEAVKQWEYRPTLLNGVPVDVETTVDVAFSLSDGVAAGASGQRQMPPPPPPAPLP
jgi:TonB family protein